MALLNLDDEQGNATLEFVLVVGLLVGPIISINQALSVMNLRQVSIAAIGETVARQYALGSNAAETAALVGVLAEDAGLQAKSLSVSIGCVPDVGCSSNSRAVDVEVRYKGAYSSSRQFMNESGSMLALTVGLLSICLALTFAGVNIEAANVFDQRVSKLARYLALEHFSDQPDFSAQYVQTEAAGLANRYLMNVREVSRATILRPEPKTLSAIVCARFEMPITLFGLGSNYESCGVSKVRLIG